MKNGGTTTRAGGPPDADRGISGEERPKPSQAKGAGAVLAHDLR